jgi:hypothetical protein
MITEEVEAKMRKHAQVNGPLMRLFNERFKGESEDDPYFLYACEQVGIISQKIWDLINGMLL